MKFKLVPLLKGDTGRIEGDGALICLSRGHDFLVRLALDIRQLLRVGSGGCSSSALFRRRSHHSHLWQGKPNCSMFVMNFFSTVSASWFGIASRMQNLVSLSIITNMYLFPELLILLMLSMSMLRQYHGSFGGCSL